MENANKSKNFEFVKFLLALLFIGVGAALIGIAIHSVFLPTGIFFFGAGLAIGCSRLL